MSSNSIEFPSFSEVIVEQNNDVIFAYMNAHPVPCFTLKILDELSKAQNCLLQRNEYSEPLFYVLASNVQGVFNLGGDLNLFYNCIQNGKSNDLLHYAIVCIDLIYQNQLSYRRNVVPIALVEGDALGGGFEAALSCDFIVAEKQANFGTPEIKFDLFPGMGAFNFIKQRTDLVTARKILSSGELYTAVEMKELGLVDYVVEKGQGKSFILSLIKERSKFYDGLHALKEIEQLTNEFSYNDLSNIVNIWVDKAMSLSAENRARIHKLAVAQRRKCVSLPRLILPPTENSDCKI